MDVKVEKKRFRQFLYKNKYMSSAFQLKFQEDKQAK